MFWSPIVDAQTTHILFLNSYRSSRSLLKPSEISISGSKSPKFGVDFKQIDEKCMTIEEFVKFLLDNLRDVIIESTIDAKWLKNLRWEQHLDVC